MYISKEGIDLLKSIPFYFGTPDVNTGALRNSETYWVRAANILNIISQANSKGNSYFSKDGSFRDSVLDYKTLNSILETLEENQLLTIDKNYFGIGSDSYIINHKYRGQCEIELNAKEIKILNSIHAKPFKRGNSATTDLSIFIDITYKQFELLMKSEGKDLETIEQQWEIIKEINETGSISPKLKRGGRLYSKFTNLSKVVHQFTRINSEAIIEIDQHATYFTLLPHALLTMFGFLSNEQMKCIKNLSKFIKDTYNIYEQISNETGIDIKDIKESTNSFICDTNTMMSSTKAEIQKWFKNRFPKCSDLINLTRKKKRLVYKLMRIEADIFVFVAKKLKKMGIPAITKHDSIIFNKADSKDVLKILEDRFITKNICQKLKTKNYIENQTPSSFESLEIAVAQSKDKSLTDKDVETQKPHHAVNFLKASKERETIVCGFSLSVRTVTDKRKRATNITVRNDGIMRVNIKNKKIYSKKNETLSEFKKRVDDSYPNIVWKNVK
jgi:hypothetical protein